MTSPHADYDRYLTAVSCDVCDRTAAWTLRFRFAGETAREMHACSHHRRQIEARARRPRPQGEEPLEVARIARTAF